MAEQLPATADGPGSRTGDAARPRWGLEVLVVLGVSLGSSAVYSVLSLVEKLTRDVPLDQQTTTMNSSATPDRPWLDLAYQLANNVFLVAPVFLVLYLLHLRPGVGGRRWMGLDARHPLRDAAVGLGIAAGIGIPGLGFYLLARELGLNTSVAPANLTDVWWAVPVLVLAAVANGALEEIVMVGYLFGRLRDLRWSWTAVVVVSALVRGSYHLYQGFGGFAGNVLMGLLLGLVFLRWRRVWPLVVAHSLLDVGAFVGYTLLAPLVSWL
ncbi:CPBP family intramembrane metalloprotease [Auraticoccus sp. F435]|uniref:CPBP family intramembrane metalloprotease n=1 Tax=Auraticoccus cholistanensis TaxID=2656650 RepID=A0A6A9UZ32_9ACTN|nr:CPBP family intramembrane glutamic endopeptidase [Auraticoccus cholistanensis]MVA77007.1 CPBP family intramembrane metalloprotease [Auraticoccus cholistanensis]